MFSNKIIKLIKSRLYNSELREKLYRIKSRLKLKNRSFTIISNNCWAWSVYEDLGVKYNTPTVGLFFYAPCYIKFLSNLYFYLDQPLLFKQTSKYELANIRRSKSQNFYPIGLLGDVEIHFLHYISKEDALEKWNRRKQRINFKNLFIVFSEVDLCELKHIKAFDNLFFLNKVFFSAKNHLGIRSQVWLKCYQDKEVIGDIVTHRWPYRKYFDVVRWLNN